MTKAVQRRRGTNAEHSSFTGLEGELSVNTTNDSVHVHDGATAGGFELARADGSNVGNFAVGGDLDVTGNVTIGGNITLGDADTDGITVNADLTSSLIPNADDTYDLGTASKEWRNLYIDGTANIDSLVADTADINGGAIDGVTIGGASAGAGTFTTFTSTGIDDNATSEKLQIADTVIHAGTNVLVGDLTTTPDGTLHVYSGSAGAVTSTSIANDLTVEGSGDTGASILSPDANYSTIYFGSPATSTGAFLQYQYAGSALDIGTQVAGFSTRLYGGNAALNLTLSGASGSQKATFAGDVAAKAYQAQRSSGSVLLDFAVFADSLSGTPASSDNLSMGNDGGGALILHTNSLERMRIDSTGNVGIGTSSPSSYYADKLVVQGSFDGDGITIVSTGTTTDSYFAFADGTTGDERYRGAIGYYHGSDALVLYSAGTERMRIESGGGVAIGKTSHSAFATTGVGIYGDATYNGLIEAVTNSVTPMAINRLGNDGDLIAFYQATVNEGSISVSGTTVSYNGGHLSRWSQLTDNSKDTSIVKGTVMTNLDAMCEWADEDNEQLNKMAVSSVEGDTNVAGVFVNWDNDDDQYNDMNVAMTGDMVIRIAQGTTVARGDLLMSAGDGTAKPQDDDIVRAKTIAKVTSTHVSHTYDDGSYLVPCVLMAC